MKKILRFLGLTALLTLFSCTTDSVVETARVKPTPPINPQEIYVITRVGIPFQVRLNNIVVNETMTYSNGIYTMKVLAASGDVISFGGGISNKIDMANRGGLGLFKLTLEDIVLFQGMDNNGPDGAAVGIDYFIQ